MDVHAHVHVLMCVRVLVVGGVCKCLCCASGCPSVRASAHAGERAGLQMQWLEVLCCASRCASAHASARAGKCAGSGMQGPDPTWCQGTSSQDRRCGCAR